MRYPPRGNRQDRACAPVQFVGVPDCDELCVVDGDLVDDQETVACYRTGDRLTGLRTMNRRAEIMKYRTLIARGATFDAAVAFAEQRRATRAARTTA
ncbi:oxidoreductase C-terminal domain-containing protein [Nocardia fluminea]|uniref:oxidoreductase C-terminal domain-containing protein n=1 Tax=Nocardia fluminea TaxID=134984 RepID=UPI0037F1ED54